MKKSFVWAFAAIVALGVSVRAMCGKCEGKHGDCESMKAEIVAQRVAELKSQLGLNADQETKIKAAIEAEVAEKCAHKKAMHEKMSAAHADTAAKIKAVLTPEQQAKLDEIHGKGMMPCCVEAAKKGEACKKCPPKKAGACCPIMGGESKKK